MKPNDDRFIKLNKGTTLTKNTKTIDIYFLRCIRFNCNILKPLFISFWENSNDPEFKRERERNNMINSGHYIGSLAGLCRDSAETNV